MEVVHHRVSDGRKRTGDGINGEALKGIGAALEVHVEVLAVRSEDECGGYATGTAGTSYSDLI
jgi:hypothetical protein